VTTPERVDVRFPSGSDECAGWLYPAPGDGPAPAVVMAHGFGGIKEARLDAYAERFQSAGYGVLVFDYRHFGASGGEPRQLVEVGRQLDDWRSALEFVRHTEAVDRSRIAVWGTSFAGGHVLEVAAGGNGVAAAISQVPFMSGVTTLRARGIGAVLRMTKAGVHDRWRALLGRPPFYAPIVGPPGTLGAMTTPDAEPGYLALIPDGIEWRNEVAARIFLTVGAYAPIRRAADVRCPLLVQAALLDAVTPAAPARRAALRAPRGELIEYAIGHFDIYLGDDFERAVADQIEFLDRHLGA
jgi:fermentation-respiration switch protein FrsA (DUF1100 family)